MDTPDLLALAVEAARRAGTLLLERFHAEATGVETKLSSTDLVSDADRDTEQMLKGFFASARPDDTASAISAADLNSTRVALGAILRSRSSSEVPVMTATLTPSLL